MNHAIEFHGELMGVIMHIHQAIHQPDAAVFIKAMVKEINSHIKKTHWALIKHGKVPTNVDVILAVWCLQRKCNTTTHVITKYKATHIIHGRKQVYVLTTTIPIPQ